MIKSIYSSRQHKSNKIFSLLLFLCVIQFSKAWLFPTLEFGDLDTDTNNLHMDAGLALAFAYFLWLMIVLAFFIAITQNQLGLISRALAPFAPFFFVGCVSALFGFDPSASFRLLFLWLATALAAVLIGTMLPPAVILKNLLWILFYILLGSFFLALFFPEYGKQPYVNDEVWRGFFISKNSLGWIAAISLTLSSAINIKPLLYLRIVTGFISIVCLLFSECAGALLSCLGAIAYGRIVLKFLDGFSISTAIVIISVSVVSLVTIILFVLPLLMELIGRDMTFTGRTDIWEMYFSDMLNSPFLGEGPGAFTSVSPFTLKLAYKLQEFGLIFTPHEIFLGAFGDSGIIGLSIFILTMLYLSLVLPLKHKSGISRLLGSLGALVILDGLVETHEIYNSGIGWFILILLYTQNISVRFRL